MLNTELLKAKGVNIPKTKLGLAKMNALVEAAEALFTQKGFYGTSISDICKEAGAAVGTFYIYFETKTAIYYYLVESYKHRIRRILFESIKGCETRYEKEKEGIKAFIKYAVVNPNIFNIIWGSLSVDKKMFEDYYMSFARSYSKALGSSREELSGEDTSTLAYMLMGVTNFVCLKAIFEKMNDQEINGLIDDSVMPVLSGGMFKH